MPPVTEVDLVALEDRVAKEATADLRKRLQVLTSRIDLYRESSESLQRVLKKQFEVMLTNLGNDDLFLVLAETVREGAREAFVAGIEQAATEIGRNPTDFLASMPDDLFDLGTDTADKARSEIEEAVRRLSVAEEPDDVEEAVLRAHRAISRTESGARWGVNRGLSSGVDEVATAAGAGRLWLGERDACVHCAAYIGHVAKPGEGFPGGLTFGAKPLTEDDLPNPPLHPRCRCRIRLWTAADGDAFPDALKREALRSVLRGWSLPSESERVRLDAAERALKRAGDMPKSVQEYARRAIKQGRFSKGRDFPHENEPKKKIRSKDGLPVKTAEDSARAYTRNVLDVLPRKTPLVRRLEETRVPSEAQRKIEEMIGLPPSGPTVIPGETDLELFQREFDRDKDVTNPNYGTAPEWGVNCQRVAVAFELRRRGYDVTARQNRKRIDKQYPDQSLAGLWKGVRDFRDDAQLSADERRAWLKANGFGTWSSGRQALYDEEARRLREIVDGWPDGARGWIVVTWRNGAGRHIFNVERKDGRTLWFDMQTNTYLGLNGEKHLSEAFEFRYLRVDELEPADDEMTRMVYPLDEKGNPRADA